MLDGSFTELMGQEGQADYARERLLKHDSQQIRGREGKESVLGAGWLPCLLEVGGCPLPGDGGEGLR